MRRGVLATCALAALVAHPLAQDEAGPAAEPRPPVRVGEPYGALRLPTLDGQQWIDLAGHRGKKVLLIEFASW